MVSPVTIPSNNTLEEYVESIGRTTTSEKDASLEKPLQLIGTTPQTTANANGISAILQANPTIAKRPMVFQNSTIHAEVTSGTGAVYIPQGNNFFLGEATKTQVPYVYDYSGLFLGNLGYTELLFWHQPGLFVPEPTPTIEELLNGPLFQVAGMFEINEPGWADKHDEYIAETLM